MPLTGSCFCGRSAYRIDQPLVRAQSCHCSRCRKLFSGAGSAFAFLVPGSFEWTAGQDGLSRYVSMEDWVVHFCGCCGTTLAAAYKGVVKGVTLGTIDDDPGIQLARHIHVASKAPWDHIGGDAPQYDQEPPD